MGLTFWRFASSLVVLCLCFRFEVGCYRFWFCGFVVFGSWAWFVGLPFAGFGSWVVGFVWVWIVDFALYVGAVQILAGLGLVGVGFRLVLVCSGFCIYSG